MTPQNLTYIEPFTELPTIPGGWEVRSFSIGKSALEIVLPASPDALLEDPAALAADLPPYWGHLWPASLEMAQAVLNADWPTGTPVLELGCGIGLVGLAGWKAGFPVVMTDYEPQAVRLALSNAARNGWGDAKGFCLDWRQPVAMQFPRILGCEVLYEVENHGLVLDVLDAMLSSDGFAWLADPQRHQTDRFVDLARKRGYRVEHQRLAPFASISPITPVSGEKPPDRTPVDLWIVSKSG